jgi:hypothetical protein
MEFRRTPKEEFSMKTVVSRAFAAAGFVGLLAMPLAAEDLTIVSSVSGGPQPMTQTQYLAADRARTHTGDQDVIVEYASGRIVTINHRTKEYTETSFAEMAAMMKKMEADLAKMPAFLQKSMGGSVKPATVQKGATPRKIAGYDCTQYTISQGDDMSFVVWAAPALEMPAKLVESMKNNTAMMGPMGRRFVAMYDEMAKIKGYPLSFATSSKMAGRKMETLIEATEVKKGPIPASAFAIPAGYTKETLPAQR